MAPPAVHRRRPAATSSPWTPDAAPSPGCSAGCSSCETTPAPTPWCDGPVVAGRPCPPRPATAVSTSFAQRLGGLCSVQPGQGGAGLARRRPPYHAPAAGIHDPGWAHLPLARPTPSRLGQRPTRTRTRTRRLGSDVSRRGVPGGDPRRRLTPAVARSAGERRVGCEHGADARLIAAGVGEDRVLGRAEPSTTRPPTARAASIRASATSGANQRSRCQRAGASSVRGRRTRLSGSQEPGG